MRLKQYSRPHEHAQAGPARPIMAGRGVATIASYGAGPAWPVGPSIAWHGLGHALVGCPDMALHGWRA